MPKNDNGFKDLVLQLLPIVEEDAEKALKVAEETGDGYDRRMAFRAVFAGVEGFLHVVKQLVLSEMQDHQYSYAEIAILNEESYLLSDRGKAYVRPRFLPIDANIKFAFDMIIREAKIPLKVDWTDKGWNALKSSLKVRHRVTHPRSINDVEVSDEEMAKLNASFIWFRNHLTRTLARALLAARYELYRKYNQLLPEDVKDILDHTDPELDYPEVAIQDEGDFSRLQEVLGFLGLSFIHENRLVLTMKGKDYVRWRSRPGEAV